jgi:hypothetical protein
VRDRGVWRRIRKRVRVMCDWVRVCEMVGVEVYRKRGRGSRIEEREWRERVGREKREGRCVRKVK